MKIIVMIKLNYKIYKKILQIIRIRKKKKLKLKRKRKKVREKQRKRKNKSEKNKVVAKIMMTMIVIDKILNYT